MGIKERGRGATERHGLHTRLPKQTQDERDTLARLLDSEHMYAQGSNNITYPLDISFEPSQAVILDLLCQPPTKVRDKACFGLLECFAIAGHVSRAKGYSKTP